MDRVNDRPVFFNEDDAKYLVREKFWEDGPHCNLVRGGV
jgi:hypothetical protein